jgi:hypothetical protein
MERGGSSRWTSKETSFVKPRVLWRDDGRVAVVKVDERFERLLVQTGGQKFAFAAVVCQSNVGVWKYPQIRNPGDNGEAPATSRAIEGGAGLREVLTADRAADLDAAEIHDALALNV